MLSWAVTPLSTSELSSVASNLQEVRSAGARMRIGAAAMAGIAAVAVLGGCSGPQSALDPAGPGAERIAGLFHWMAIGSAVIWLGLLGLTVYLTRMQPDEHEPKLGHRLIFFGGVVLPTIVLTVLLVFGLDLLNDLVEPPTSSRLRVEIVGEEWWWRVRYLPEQGDPVTAANEVRLPQGEPVVFEVTAHDVIHSFWIPSLGGKIDMIPGRRNTISLMATRTGVFRGTCSEYCGMAHALMAFSAIVMPADEFDAWLEEQRSEAVVPQEALARRGSELFLANGCDACHTVRGTAADGALGPDLTHVASRHTIGAGLLPPSREAFRRWIARPDKVKPGVLMPGYAALPEDVLDALVAYMTALR